jgi:hypothetical protein
VGLAGRGRNRQALEHEAMAGDPALRLSHFTDTHPQPAGQAEAIDADGDAEAAPGSVTLAAAAAVPGAGEESIDADGGVGSSGIPVSFDLNREPITPTPTLSHSDCMRTVSFVDVWGSAKCDQWIFQIPTRCKAGNYALNCAAACHPLLTDKSGSQTCTEWIREATKTQGALDICSAPNYQRNCAKTCHGCTLANHKKKGGGGAG